MMKGTNSEFQINDTIKSNGIKFSGKTNYGDVNPN
jgi:hypothetical protein